MAEIDISGEIVMGGQALDLNKLKSHIGKHVYIILCMSSKDNVPYDIIAVENYIDLSPAMKKYKVREKYDYHIIISGQPEDPRNLPYTKRPSQIAWVLSDPILGDGFRRCQTMKEVVGFIEGFVEDENGNYRVDDFIVMLGIEVFLPKKYEYNDQDWMCFG